MKKLSNILLLILISGILFANCNNTTSPSSNQELMPLKIGNYWKYRFIEYDSLGNKTDSVIIKCSISRDSLMNGETIYKIDEEGFPDYVDILPAYLLHRTDGLYSYAPDKDSIPSILAKYPAEQGDKYYSDGDTILVENTGINYSVPAGTYKCYKYFMQYRQDDIIYKVVDYYSPEIGLISEEHYYQDKNHPLYLEGKVILTGYKIN